MQRNLMKNESLNEKGFFGLTSRINIEISAGLSKILIWLFYLLPILAIGIVLTLRKIGII